MALNTQIWIDDVVEGFWPDNSFISRSVDHSSYVNNRTVHIPQAGSAPQVTKNRSSFPATIGTREDSELTYDLDLYDVPPLRVQHLADVELSYDKRQSMLKQSKETLMQYVHMDILKKWVPTGVTTVATSGDAVPAHVHSTATGNRKKMTRADVEKIKMIFDSQDVVAEGRTILLDAIMYNQLMNSLTDAEVVSFLNGADAIKGVMGKFLGFDFLMRSTVFECAAGGSLKTGSAAATDCAGGLAWQKDSVSRALGEVTAYEDSNNPSYYGDIFSFAVRAGGSSIRADKKGIVLLYQGTAE